MQYWYILPIYTVLYLITWEIKFEIKYFFLKYTLPVTNLVFPDLAWQMPECILAPIPKRLYMYEGSP